MKNDEAITDRNIKEFNTFFIYDANNFGIMRRFDYCGRSKESKPGSVDKSGTNLYRKIYLKGRQYREHQIVWTMFHGKICDGMVIDHINGNGLDNRIENLRCVERIINCKNCRMRSENKSGINGVIWHASLNKWMAYINENGKRIHLGYFHDKQDAANARIEANRKFGYTERHGIKNEIR